MFIQYDILSSFAISVALFYWSLIHSFTFKLHIHSVIWWYQEFSFSAVRAPFNGWSSLLLTLTYICFLSHIILVPAGPAAYLEFFALCMTFFILSFVVISGGHFCSCYSSKRLPVLLNAVSVPFILSFIAYSGRLTVLTHCNVYMSKWHVTSAPC